MSTVSLEATTHVITCPECGDVPTGARSETGRRIAASHHARMAHDSQTIDLTSEPAQRVLARSASLQLAVVAATARIGMWQACPAMDKARNAEQVLEEVRHLLQGAG